MKILYFSHGFPSPNSRFIWNELEYFQKSGEIVYLSIYESAAAKEQPFLTKVIPFDESRWRKKIRWLLWKYDLLCDFRNRRFREALNEFLERFNPDVIHCHFAYEGLTLLHNLEKRRPVILHFHGYDASEMLHKKSYISALKIAFAFQNVHCIYVSNNIKERLAEVGLVNKRSTVIYCGIETSEFILQPVAGTHEIFRFVQVSNLQEKKGIEYAIKAFGKMLQSVVQPQRFRFLIAGDGPMRLLLEELTRGLGLERQVRFLGQISKEEVIELLKKAHVFVHHSVTSKNGDQEGIPTALMEAMAMGIPVLSTLHSGIPELVKDQVHGYLSPERDVNDLAHKMRLISEWSDFRLITSRQWIESQFSQHRHVQDLEDLYKNLYQQER